MGPERGGSSGVGGGKELPPTTRERVKKDRSKKDTADFGSSNLDALRMVEDVPGTQLGEGANTDENWPRAGEADPNAGAWK